MSTSTSSTLSGADDHPYRTWHRLSPDIQAMKHPEPLQVESTCQLKARNPRCQPVETFENAACLKSFSGFDKLENPETQTPSMSGSNKLRIRFCRLKTAARKLGPYVSHKPGIGLGLGCVSQTLDFVDNAFRIFRWQPNYLYIIYGRFVASTLSSTRNR